MPKNEVSQGSIKEAENKIVDTVIRQINRDVRLVGPGIAIALAGVVYRACLSSSETLKRAGIPGDEWLDQLDQWRVLMQVAIDQAEKDLVGKETEGSQDI